MKLDNHFGMKKAELVEGNRRALADAHAWASTQSSVFPRLAPPVPSTNTPMMTGNGAIASGALPIDLAVLNGILSTYV